MTPLEQVSCITYLHTSHHSCGKKEEARKFKLQLQQFQLRIHTRHKKMSRSWQQFGGFVPADSKPVLGLTPELKYNKHEYLNCLLKEKQMKITNYRRICCSCVADRMNLATHLNEETIIKKQKKKKVLTSVKSMLRRRSTKINTTTTRRTV